MSDEDKKNWSLPRKKRIEKRKTNKKNRVYTDAEKKKTAYKNRPKSSAAERHKMKERDTQVNRAK